MIYDCQAIEQWVSNCLRLCGFSPRHIGYYWIRESIICCIRDFRGSMPTFKGYVFPRIKNPAGTSFMYVERNMRYAISQAFLEGDNRYQLALLGHSFKPTVTEFIAAAAELGARELSKSIVMP